MHFCKPQKSCNPDRMEHAWFRLRSFLSRSVPVLYYNKDRFKEAGLEEAPVTWDVLKADAKALTGNGSYGYSCPLDQWYYMSLVMNAGGTIFNETEDGIGFAGDPGTKPLYLWKEMIADVTMHVPSGQEYP